MNCRKLTLALVAALALGATSVQAEKVFRWSSQGDFLTFDFAAVSEALNFNAAMTVYEPLVNWSPDVKIQPCLAESWSYDAAKGGWIFRIRQGVKFHEGETLTADDVVFSLRRALGPRSSLKSYLGGVSGAEKLSDTEVLVKTASGSPIVLNQLTLIFVMSKSWAEKHNCAEIPNYKAKEENYATRHANGTGPFILHSRDPEIKTVFVKNPDWWNNARRIGNCDRVEYNPIKSAATRTAALVSGELDFVLDPPPQDFQRILSAPGLKMETGSETRALFVTMDQTRDETPYLHVPGKTGVNPLKDIRVRKAMYLAINEDAIIKSVMRNLADPAGIPIARAVTGWTEKLNERLPYDPAQAKKLLAEAGYPDGFSFTFDVPSGRYMNDEAIGKAIAAMWARVGLEAKVNPVIRAKYFPKITSRDTSVTLVGWGVATIDGLNPLQNLLATYDRQGNGYGNIGMASSPALDKLVEAIKVEGDADKRTRMMQDAFQICKDELMLIPLHSQKIAWAMSRSVEVPIRPDNRVSLDWVRMK